MKQYSLSPTGKLLTIIVISGVLFAIGLGLYNLITFKTYFTCAQLKEDGYTSIKQGQPHYEASMDRDHDGYSCE